jgi:hypothetical protein
MFASTTRLAEEIRSCLTAILALGGGRYACVIDEDGIRFEEPEAADAEGLALRAIISDRRTAVLGLGTRLASEEPMEDVFAGCEREGLFVAILNGRVALIVSSPRPEALREQSRQPLRALADRLMRFNPAYGADARGRGFFFGRPRLDLIVVSPAEP